MFVATGHTAAHQVNNNGFFPDLSSDDFIKTQKLDGIISGDRLVFALTLAISQVNTALMDWQLSQQRDGYMSLNAVPSSSINNQSRLIALYKQAVFSFAKAQLVEHYRDFDTTALGNKKAEMLDMNIDIYRRDANWAIADIQGKSRAIVELI
ncbi:head completion/stabilization protein [Agitococcus lubricus]|uniref:Head completion protein GPL n=1 Tax=Agitococcus lubricus TaxID=1077255 RepID=A0A2T5J1G9_9GAMM|nr:head completion/stabilization protein [Agitococcus lubricus]PTQ90291.1 head completion protein GPL [Agitococcus lubricus]